MNTTTKSGTLNVRNIDPEAAERLKTSAAARNLTIGRFLPKLSQLHEELLRRAEYDPDARALLDGFGLGPVGV